MDISRTCSGVPLCLSRSIQTKYGHHILYSSGEFSRLTQTLPHVRPWMPARRDEEVPPCRHTEGRGCFHGGIHWYNCAVFRTPSVTRLTVETGSTDRCAPALNASALSIQEKEPTMHAQRA